MSSILETPPRVMFASQRPALSLRAGKHHVDLAFQRLDALRQIVIVRFNTADMFFERRETNDKLVMLPVQGALRCAVVTAVRAPPA